jgi:hypothetical protein
LIEVYRALGGGWQIRLGERSSETLEPAVLERPLLEEIPAPGVENGVEVQSFLSPWGFLDQADDDSTSTQPAATETPAILNLESAAEQKTS